MRVLSTLFLALGLVAAFAARASGDYVDLEQRLTPEQRHATGIDTLTPEQLALLNQLLRNDQQHQVETARSEVRNEMKSAPATERAAGPARLAGLDDGPIHSRAEGRIEGWQPGTVFSLANGQRWKVLKGDVTLRAPLESPEVVVVPGVAGRWFLQVVEDMPKARVYRID